MHRELDAFDDQKNPFVGRWPRNADAVMRIHTSSESIATILNHRREEIRRCVSAQLMKSTGRVKTAVHIDEAISHILWRLFELFNAHVGQVDNAMGELSLFPDTSCVKSSRRAL